MTHLLQDPGGLGVFGLVIFDQTLRGLGDGRVWEPDQRVELKGDRRESIKSKVLKMKAIA